MIVSGVSASLDRSFDRHPWTQIMLRILAPVDTYADRKALHDLHVVAARVLRRKETEEWPRGSGHVLDGALVVAAEGIHVYRDRLPRVHVPQLSFLEVRRDPDVVQRHHCHKRLAGLDPVAKFNRLMAHHAADWRINFGVTQI